MHSWPTGNFFPVGKATKCFQFARQQVCISMALAGFIHQHRCLSIFEVGKRKNIPQHVVSQTYYWKSSWMTAKRSYKVLLFPDTVAVHQSFGMEYLYKLICLFVSKK